MIILSPRFSLLWLLYRLVQGEVVDSFLETCPQFFANPGGRRTPPTVFPEPRYQQICQKNKNVHEYATLYDTENKIPVYSSYKYVGRAKCKRKSTWNIEPQLEDTKLPKDMNFQRSVPQKVRGNNQALNRDYFRSGYDKGHLFPVFHTNTQRCADSTFTLTNAAPQDPSFNSGQWRKLEEDVDNYLSRKHLRKYAAFVVTGVVPSNGTTVKLINEKVNVPSHFWSAYCCLDNNLRRIHSKGYLGPNDNQEPMTMTTHDLDQKLSILYGTDFKVFGGEC